MNTKEKADALVEKHYDISKAFRTKIVLNHAIEHSIVSVEHTIEVLENVMFKTAGSAREIDYAISEQTEILNELKSRL